MKSCTNALLYNTVVALRLWYMISRIGVVHTNVHFILHFVHNGLEFVVGMNHTNAHTSRIVEPNDLVQCVVALFLRARLHYHNATKLDLCINCRHNGDLVDIHDVHAQFHILTASNYLGGNRDNVAFHGLGVAPHRNSFQPGDRWSIDLLRVVNVPRGDRTILDPIHTHQILEIFNRRCTNTVI